MVRSGWWWKNFEWERKLRSGWWWKNFEWKRKSFYLPQKHLSRQRYYSGAESEMRCVLVRLASEKLEASDGEVRLL
jgi:hypothetical protein